MSNVMYDPGREGFRSRQAPARRWISPGTQGLTWYSSC